MNSFLPFFIILLAGLLISSFFKRFHVPWVVTLIIAGVLIGPFGFKLFESNETIDFISETGLVLLMFMAGLETKLSNFKDFQVKLFLLSFINGFIPFLAGLGIAYYFGLGITTSFLIGIIFVSSSVAVVIPSLESTGLIKKPLGISVLATSIIQDIASLVLLSVFLQSENTLANLPLFIFYPLTIAILIGIRFILPKLQQLFIRSASGESELFNRDIRAVLLILFGVVILFEILGLHPIIAGFFAGLVLSDSLESEILQGKIRAISYGIFIPTFFIIVGTQTDLSILLKASQSIIITLTIVLGSILTKFASGFVGAQIIGFNKVQSAFFGATSIPQLSTTLAASFTGYRLGILSSDLLTILIILSVTSTILGPTVMRLLESFALSAEDKKFVK